jgi:hypothetical protein
VREPGLSVHSEVDDSTGHADRRLGRLQSRSFGRSILLKNLRWRRRRVKFVRIGRIAAGLDLRELFLALLELIDWLKR